MSGNDSFEACYSSYRYARLAIMASHRLYYNAASFHLVFINILRKTAVSVWVDVVKSTYLALINVYCPTWIVFIGFGMQCNSNSFSQSTLGQCENAKQVITRASEP